MSLNQYAVYQLKPDMQIKPLRYKSYQYLLDNHIPVDADHYHQVYLATLIGNTTPNELRIRLEKKLPPKFMGTALNVSDVIAVTKEGISTAYYVDKNNLVVVPGFFRMNSSAALITMDTAGFVFEDRKGSWMATDEMVVDGKQFFLMVSETYGHNAAYAVVDAEGRKAAEDTPNGFDEETIQQIRQFLHPSEPLQDVPTPEKPQMEIWQKFYENGEYLRSAESYGEQNYDMIDGRTNNRPKQLPGKSSEKPRKDPMSGVLPAEEPARKQTDGRRKSVLRRLRDKQEEVAARYGKMAPEQEKEDMERNRK